MYTYTYTYAWCSGLGAWLCATKSRMSLTNVSTRAHIPK